jgi:arylsulfatase A-like enzyme/Flp pilus assembly protein TadD
MRPTGRVNALSPREVVLLAVVLITASGAQTLKAAGRAAANKPNVLLITIDTLRPDRLGCYGSPYLKTPEIDALAARGVVFTRAFAHNPETLPSHTNILLGLTPLAHGVHDNTNFVVRPEFLTIPAWLKDRGYATGAVIGAFPLDSRFGLTRGFDNYDDDYGTQDPAGNNFVERNAEIVVSRAVAWIGKREGPWFLWIHLFDPHQPYSAPEPFKTRFRNDGYSGEVAFTDQALGRLFGFLREKRLEDATVVVLTADHGESLGEHGEGTHGYFAYDSTIRVPLIIASPGMKPGRTDQNVCHIDIFPTVCELLGAEKPAPLQGASLVPAMKGRNIPGRQIYFESLMAFYTRGWAPLRGFVEGRMKFIDSPLPEIYDLDKDPREAANMVSRTDLKDYRSKMTALLAGSLSGSGPSAKRVADAETREKLKSLGYLSSSSAPAPKKYSPEYDLKTLLPYHNRVQEAEALFARGKTDEAVAVLEKVIAERNDIDVAFTDLARYYRSLNRLDRAAEVLRQGHHHNPDSFTLATLFGSYLVDLDRTDEAIGIITKALGAVDYDPEAWNFLGVAWWKKKNYPEALKAYNRALALDGNYAIVVNNLGTLYLSMFLSDRAKDSYDKAVAAFRRAVRIDPGYASAYNGLGAALKVGGDIDGAIANWTKAIELKPDFGFALYNLGLACMAKGDKTAALAHFMDYKDKFSSLMSSQEIAELDSLIRKCSD